MTSIDLGCGDNIVNACFVGVDRRQTKYTKVVAEADDLSCFGDSSVNVVFSRRCIQHVANDVKVFEEINRILTPDGMAVVEVASVCNALVSNAKLFKNKEAPVFCFSCLHNKRLKEKVGNCWVESCEFRFGLHK